MELSLSVILAVGGGTWLVLSLIGTALLWAACSVGSERRHHAVAATPPSPSAAPGPRPDTTQAAVVPVGR